MFEELYEKLGEGRYQEVFRQMKIMDGWGRSDFLLYLAYERGQWRAAVEVARMYFRQEEASNEG